MGSNPTFGTTLIFRYVPQLNSSPSKQVRSSVDLTDSFGRKLTYLRISVTDRCNMRCRYCIAANPSWMDSEKHLTAAEIARVVSAACRLGVRKIRLTGGEPLLRQDLRQLLEMLAREPRIQDLSLSTNGLLLSNNAGLLREAGLHRVNISIDSLDPKKFCEITGRDALDEVQKGILAAIDAGLNPVKLNVVVIRGFNDDELIGFASIAQRLHLEVRFIEFMPTDSMAVEWSEEKVVPAAEMMELLRRHFELEPIPESDEYAGPSNSYVIANGNGRIGFITAISHGFCGSCNRIRLTADGKLRACLASDLEVDLRSVLRTGITEQELERLLVESAATKVSGHNWSHETPNQSCSGMNRIGG